MLQEKIKGCSLEVSELEYDGDMSSSDHEGIMGDRDPEEIPNSNEKAAREKTKAAVEQLRLMKRLPRRWSLPLRMPPLLADFIYCRACKPICAKLLTLPQKLPFVVEKAKKFAIITFVQLLGCSSAPPPLTSAPTGVILLTRRQPDFPGYRPE